MYSEESIRPVCRWVNPAPAGAGRHLGGAMQGRTGRLGPMPLWKSVRTQARVLRVGQVEGLREQIFVASVQRQFRNPAVAVLINHARKKIFERN